MFFSFIFLPSTICRGLNSDVTIFRDFVFWRHFRGISFYNNRAISINREWFVRESRPWNDVGMARFKKGNNFPLSTPTVRRKDVKMLRTQVEPRAASKCGFTQVWHRFKHFHWLRIYSWQECRFSTNQRARNRSVTGETLIGPYRPPRNDVKMFKTQVQYKPQASVIKVYQFGTFQLTSVNSQGLYQNWSKFPRFLPKLLQLTRRCVNFFFNIERSSYWFPIRRFYWLTVYI